MSAERGDALKILLVEDNFLVGAGIRRMLVAMGHDVVGPVASNDEACRKARSDDFGFAVLDVNLRDGTSEEVAEALRERACPFIFITGYGSPRMLPASLRHVRRLTKPVDAIQLEASIRGEMRRD